MKKNKISGIFLIALVAIWGFDDLYSQNHEKMMNKPNLDLTLSVGDTNGLKLIGKLTFTNLGEEPLDLPSPLFHGSLNIVVFDKSWNLVTPRSFGKVHVAFEGFHLDPGQAAAFELPDLRYTAHNAQMMYELLSGQYYVLAIYHPVFDHKSKENIPAVMIASNIEKIEIP